MSRRSSFGTTARSIIRAAAQAERARQVAERRHQADLVRADRQAERLAKAHSKEALRQYASDRAEEAESLSAEIRDREHAIETMLLRALDREPSVDFKRDLYQYHTEGTFARHEWVARAPKTETFEPIRPNFLVRWLSKKYALAVAVGQAEYERAKAEHEAQTKAAESEFYRKQDVSRLKISEHNKRLDQIKIGLASAGHDSVVEYFRIIIIRSLREEIDAFSAEIGYSSDSRHLVVDIEFPDISVIPEETSFKYVKSNDRIEPVLRNSTKRRSLYASLLNNISLKAADTIFRGSNNFDNIIECLTLNGMLDTIDPATGRQIRVCLISVRITRDDFFRLNLRQVQPEQCLRSLKASVSRSPAELLPVKPIVELDMVDPRFIDSSDVLSSLDTRPNLMELTPGEFESLITNLFARMGLDTRQTQASRDGGVDCVAFDQRPIFGGKVVIQAKRYKNIVGVSAVRDLFGTVQNEGASKGILVTTSGYGKASFEFARGKPLELLDGGNLLHLLKEHADIDAKIMAPADWIDTSTHGD